AIWRGKVIIIVALTGMLQKISAWRGKLQPQPSSRRARREGLQSYLLFLRLQPSEGEALFMSRRLGVPAANARQAAALFCDSGFSGHLGAQVPQHAEHDQARSEKYINIERFAVEPPADQRDQRDAHEIQRYHEACIAAAKRLGEA